MEEEMKKNATSSKELLPKADQVLFEYNYLKIIYYISPFFNSFSSHWLTIWIPYVENIGFSCHATWILNLLSDQES